MNHIALSCNLPSAVKNLYCMDPQYRQFMSTGLYKAVDRLSYIYDISTLTDLVPQCSAILVAISKEVVATNCSSTRLPAEICELKTSGVEQDDACKKLHTQDLFVVACYTQN